MNALKNKTILIVDDEPDILELLDITICRMGCTAITASNVTQAKQLLESHKIDLCLTDMQLPDGTGLELIAAIQALKSPMPVAVITAFGSTELAVSSLKAGAFDFINKPLDIERLRGLIGSALKVPVDSSAISNSSEIRLLGTSTAAQELRQQIERLARSQAPVFISGESGSGKEVVARLVHANGPRSSGPFVPVNCGAIPRELVESEFFGHIKGSFTGAYDNKKGLFESAQGGTLFLDEVADLPLDMQVKLLRAIQEKAVRPVGGSGEIPVDVRLLSATHKDLGAEVDNGRFRTDLFYRINVIEVTVPSLRERADDVPLLAQHILDRLAKEWGRPRVALAKDALLALSRYQFPGNVRELENIMERAMTLCASEQISEQDLLLPSGSTAGPSAAPESQHDTRAKNEHKLEDAQGNLEGYLQDIECQIIVQAMEKCRWNRTEASKLLGISFRQLRYKLDKLNLDTD